MIVTDLWQKPIDFEIAIAEFRNHYFYLFILYPIALQVSFINRMVFLIELQISLPMISIPMFLKLTYNLYYCFLGYFRNYLMI